MVTVNIPQHILTYNPNNYAITIGMWSYFISYGKNIAIENRTRGKIIMDKIYWDYSKTTNKYRNLFLNLSDTQVKEMVKSGEIELRDLNKVMSIEVEED